MSSSDYQRSVFWSLTAASEHGGTDKEAGSHAAPPLTVASPCQSEKPSMFSCHNGTEKGQSMESCDLLIVTACVGLPPTIWGYCWKTGSASGRKSWTWSEGNQGQTLEHDGTFTSDCYHIFNDLPRVMMDASLLPSPHWSLGSCNLDPYMGEDSKI